MPAHPFAPHFEADLCEAREDRESCLRTAPDFKAELCKARDAHSLRRDPRVDRLFQQGQRQRALVEHGHVELADVETRSEQRPCTIS